MMDVDILNPNHLRYPDYLLTTQTMQGLMLRFNNSFVT